MGKIVQPATFFGGALNIQGNLDVAGDIDIAGGINLSGQLDIDKVQIGKNITASGDNLVIGIGAESTGQNSGAVGNQSVASAKNASAFGYNSQATGPNATALGIGAKALDDSTAVGKGAQVINGATNSIAIGLGSTVEKDNRFSFGDRDVRMPLGRSFTYPEDPGEQTMVDAPISNSLPQGSKQAYSFEVGGETVAEVSAKSDGSGGVTDKIFDVPGTITLNKIDSDDFSVSSGLVDLSGSSLESGGTVIWDSSNQYIPQDRLENDTISITDGNGIKNTGDVSLGDNISIDVAPTEFTGDTIDVDGSDNIDVNIGRGITTSASGSLQFDESISYDFASDISFNSSISIADFQDLEPRSTEPAAPGSGIARLYVKDTSPPEIRVKDNSGGTTTLMTLSQ